MYSSSYYKLEARRLLSKGYVSALIGTLILLIPSYLLSLINSLFPLTLHGALCTIAVSFIFGIFVTNILTVGYYRFLKTYEKEIPANSKRPAPRHDYNLILSGFTYNFRNTFKVMFMRELYMLGWILTGLAPILLFFGAMVFLIHTTDAAANVYSLFTQTLISPTSDMLQNFSDHVMANCPYLPIVMLLTLFMSIAASIPAIMKNYEYAVIPMILADHPNMDVPHAFGRARDIMTGYKLKYFLIQLSFILYIVLPQLIYMITQSYLIYTIITLVFSPYINMTLLRFYRELNNIIEYNIMVHGRPIL